MFALTFFSTFMKDAIRPANYSPTPTKSRLATAPTAPSRRRRRQPDRRGPVPGMTDKVRRALATARATVGTAAADGNAN